MLLEEGAIEERVVRNLLAWPHTGCGTHVSREIPADATTAGVVAHYMTRPPITPERMLGEASKAQVIYRSDAVHPRHQANFRVFDPLDFLAEVSAHIPDSHEKTTLLHGWHANWTRGHRKRHGPLAKAEAAERTANDEGTRAPLESRRSWARLLRQVYAVDPLLCPRCGGTMRVIAVIEPACADLLARGAQASTADRRPAVVRQILAHLGLPTTAPGLRGPPDQPASRVADPPREWSYEPLG
jgi:Putative transposase